MRLRAYFAGAVLVLGVGCGSSPPPDPVNVCEAPGGGQIRVDLDEDIDHCGSCDNACPFMVYRNSTCAAGECVSAPCAPGWVNLDRTIPGCESEDRGPVPESGVVFWTVAGAGAYGAGELSSTSYRTQAVLGETTPAPDGGVELQSANYRNLTGFNAILH